jgi:hypothetical protein
MTSFATPGLIRRATSALFWLVTIGAILPQSGTVKVRHRSHGHADQDRRAVRAKLDRHEGLQWLERAVAVKGADLLEADSRPTPCARCRD